MAATHAHYIRTIHTSFTAAHPHSSSAWANAASTASSQYLNNLNLSLNSLSYSHIPRSSSPAAPQVHQNTSINTHNTHMYTHHLRDLTHSPRPNAHHNHNHHHQHQQGVNQNANPSQFHGQVQAPQTQPGSHSRLPRAAAAAADDARSPSPTTLSLPYPHSQAHSHSQTQTTSDMPVRTTRRRSASIRAAPSSISLSLASKRPKFDPFADEPIVPVLSLSADSGVRDAAGASENSSQGDLKPYVEESQGQGQGQGNVPYTIHIPAAQLDEIREYAASVSKAWSDPPATPRLAAASLPVRAPSPPAPTTTNTTTGGSRRLSAHAPSFTPMALKSTTTTTASAPVAPAPAPTLAPSAAAAPAPANHSHNTTLLHTVTPSPNPNLSKVVASILLNRVHAVGKPMRLRRRVNQVCGGNRLSGGMDAGANGYVKSCLSSVVSVGVEA